MSKVLNDIIAPSNAHTRLGLNNQSSSSVEYYTSTFPNRFNETAGDIILPAINKKSLHKKNFHPSEQLLWSQDSMQKTKTEFLKEKDRLLKKAAGEKLSPIVSPSDPITNSEKEPPLVTLEAGALSVPAFIKQASTESTHHTSVYISQEEQDNIMYYLKEADLGFGDLPKLISLLEDRSKVMVDEVMASFTGDDTSTKLEKLVETVSHNVDEIQDLSNQLSAHKKDTYKMHEGIKEIQSENNLLGLVEENQQDLLDIIQSITHSLKIDERKKTCLTERPDFENELKNILRAASQFSKSLKKNFGHGLESLAAIQNQKRELRKYKSMFANATAEFLADFFQREASKVKDLKSFDSSRKHIAQFEELILNPLFEEQELKQFRRAYIQAFSDRYEQVFSTFMDSLQQKVRDKQQTSHFKSYPFWNVSQKWSPNEPYDPKPNSYPAILQQALNQALEIMSDEKKFAHQMFRFKDDNSTRKIDDMLSKLFSPLVFKFNSLVDNAFQSDPLNIATFIHCTDVKYRECTENGEAFLSTQLILLESHSKSLLNQYTGIQCDFIRSSKISIKVAGVLPFFQRLPSFLLDLISRTNFDLERNDQGEPLLNESTKSTAQKVCQAIFKWLTFLAAKNHKYSDVAQMENYWFFIQVFEGCEIDVLEEYVKKAKSKFRIHRKKYVKWSLKRELKDFYDQVSLVSRELKKRSGEVLHVYVPKAKLQKGLKALTKLPSVMETMYNRLRKHLPNNSELREAVWKRMMRQCHHHMKSLENNLALNPTLDGILPVSAIDVEHEFRQYLNNKDVILSSEEESEDLSDASSLFQGRSVSPSRKRTATTTSVTTRLSTRTFESFSRGRMQSFTQMDRLSDLHNYLPQSKKSFDYYSDAKSESDDLFSKENETHSSQLEESASQLKMTLTTLQQSNDGVTSEILNDLKKNNIHVYE